MNEQKKFNLILFHLSANSCVVEVNLTDFHPHPSDHRILS